MIPQTLSFVDVETTGTSPQRDRIIDIGIVRVEDGKIKGTLDTLIDPQDFLPPEITLLTGITSDHLKKAPTFRQQKEKIDGMLRDSVIVAHNARFDTSFLKNEYERVGESFNPKHICTAKLSRMMFPRFRHHNLDSIIDRFGFVCTPRHRAFPDAMVLWDFFRMLMAQGNRAKLEKAIKFLLRRPSIPKGINPDLLDKLPEKPGVYIFYGDKGSPLYVGKSINIKSRVMSHFYESAHVSREFSISQQVTHIDFLETEGELSALLREKEQIASLKPIYNRRLRESKSMTVLLSFVTKDGYYSIRMAESTEITAEDIPSILGVYKTKGKAKRALLELSKDFFLCNILLGIEKGSGPCFGFQIENCFGACSGGEPPVKYNLRFVQAFARTKVKEWPFEGPVIIPEGSKGHLIYKWCYLGLMKEDEAFDSEIKQENLEFDWDTYKILVNHILNPKKIVNLRVIKTLTGQGAGVSVGDGVMDNSGVGVGDGDGEGELVV